MTELLFRKDAYQREAESRVVDASSEGIVLDASLFYPTGGGQPGDSGGLHWSGGQCRIQTAIKGEAGQVVLIPVEGASLPQVGETVTQTLEWEPRFGNMRIHTALHLLSVVLPFEVSGGSISPLKGRLDFNMPEAPGDKIVLQEQVQALIDQDLIVSEDWITDEELDANPQLVKTMSVSPPRGSGRVRLVRIGTKETQIDLQPCGGTHVRSTAEVGKIRIGKIEKKGKQNRRVYLHLVT